MPTDQPDPHEAVVRKLVDQMTAAGMTTEQMLQAAFNQQMRGLGSWPPRRPQPVLLPGRTEPATYRVRLDLDGATPPIWRRLDLSSDLTLDRLHAVIGAALDWHGWHLHAFVMGAGGRRQPVAPFSTADDIDEPHPDDIPESTVHLDQVLGAPGDVLCYDYDFGDGWEHTIRLEKILPRQDGEPPAICLTGRRAGPPEDCGGLYGLQEILDTLAGRQPESRTRDEILDSLPLNYDPAYFDVETTNLAIALALGEAGRQTGDEAGPHPGELSPALADLLTRLSPRDAAALLVPARLGSPDPPLTDAEVALATARFTTLLTEIGATGTELTAAGYLKPAVVTRLATALGGDYLPYGATNRETNVLVVRDLREMATRAGLIRKAKGRLSVTASSKAARADPRKLLAHLLSRMPLTTDRVEVEAGTIYLLALAAGQEPETAVQTCTQVLRTLGWRTDDGLIEVYQVGRVLYPTRRDLRMMTADYLWNEPLPDYLRTIVRLMLRAHPTL